MLHLMVWFLKRQRLTKQSPRDVTIVIGLYVPPGQGCGRSSDSGQLRNNTRSISEGRIKGYKVAVILVPETHQLFVHLLALFPLTSAIESG